MVSAGNAERVEAMEKRGDGMALGVQSKPVEKRRVRRRKGLARLVMDYLTSDTYMYAPLIGPSPADPSSTASNDICSPIAAGRRPPGTLREIEIKRATAVVIERKLARVNSANSNERTPGH